MRLYTYKYKKNLYRLVCIKNNFNLIKSNKNGIASINASAIFMQYVHCHLGCKGVYCPVLQSEDA